MSYSDTCTGESGFHRLVSGYKYLEYAPSGQVSQGTIDEDDEVAGRLSFKSHEGHVRLGSIIKEMSAHLVDGIRTDATCHTVDACHGAHGLAWEEVAGHREQVG